MFLKTLAVGVFIGISNLGGHLVLAASDAKAIACAEGFVSKYNSLKGYQTVMTKREYSKGKIINDEMIGLTEIKPSKIIFEYLNRGSTGIKNNGMTVSYSGTEKLSLELGKTHGLGFLANGAASIVLGKSIDLTGKRTLDGEIFTINRAGFGYLAKALQYHLPDLKTTKMGGLTLDGPDCSLRYSADKQTLQNVDITPESNLFDLEEKHGTLAYMLFWENRDHFNSFFDLFHRKSSMEIRIPEWFFDFHLTIDTKTNLPVEFILYIDQTKAGEYLFTKTVPSF